MDGKDQSELFHNVKRDQKMTGFSPTFMFCELNLDEIDLTREKPNNASEDEGTFVKEDEEKKI